jgi:hypothetical protein
MDTSKHIFQLHGVNAAEAPVLRKKLRRKEMVTFFENGSHCRLRSRSPSGQACPLGSLANEPDFPMVVWAFAQKHPNLVG